jgi:hypothetical protein
MKIALFVSILLSVVLVGGCRQNADATSEAAVASTSLSPEQLGELGAQIKKEPNRAQEILSPHGLNEQSFEAAIRQVTQDPEASKRYTEAFQKASA